MGQTDNCPKTTEAEDLTSYYVSICSSTLSVIGSILTIIFLQLNKKREQQPTSVKLIFLLAVCDLLSSGFMLGSYITLIQHTQTHTLCFMFRLFIQFFVLAAFLWTSVIAWVIRREQIVTDPETTDSDFLQHARRTTVYHLTAWGIPFLITLYTILQPSIMAVSRTGWCALTPDFEIAFWVVPLVASIIWNLVMYLTIVRQLRASLGNFPSERPVILQMWARFSFYILAFVVCWVWDFINHFYAIAGFCTPFAILNLEYFFSPLQGFLNFIIYTGSSIFVRPSKPGNDSGFENQRLMHASSYYGSGKGKFLPPDVPDDMINSKIYDYYARRTVKIQN